MPAPCARKGRWWAASPSSATRPCTISSGRARLAVFTQRPQAPACTCKLLRHARRVAARCRCPAAQIPGRACWRCGPRLPGSAAGPCTMTSKVLQASPVYGHGHASRGPSQAVKTPRAAQRLGQRASPHQGAVRQVPRHTRGRVAQQLRAAPSSTSHQRQLVHHPQSLRPARCAPTPPSSPRNDRAARLASVKDSMARPAAACRSVQRDAPCQQAVTPARWMVA